MSSDGALKTSETWKNEDNLTECLHFCGWPEPAVKAVVRGCDNIPGMCDTASEGSQAWQVAPFPCAFWVNLPLCAGTMCLPLCGMATQIRTLQKTEHLEGGKGTCLEHLIAACATSVFCVSPCYVASMRTSLRKKYDIQGSKCMDFWCVCCFAPCTVCQEANELQQRAGLYIPYAPLPGKKSEKVSPAAGAAHDDGAATQKVAVGQSPKK